MSQRSLFAESTSVTIEALPNVRQPNESIAGEAAQFITPEHLDAAKDWPDWHECLMWAWECEATVAEMQAWRRAFKGESK